MKLVSLFAAAAVLGACATTDDAMPMMEAGSGTVSTANERVQSTNGYSSPFWESDEFVGTHRRVVDGNTVRMVMAATGKGGLDTGVSRELGSAQRPTVDQIHPDHYVCFKYDVDLQTEGKWWAGPKISVNWNDDPNNIHGTKGWFENYIVETASQTPQELEADLTGDYFKGEYLGSTTHDGGTYRHFKIFFMDWVQFWAVRDSWRDEGATSIGPILAKWREHGLTDQTYDGSKINIETYDATKGEVMMAGYIPRDAMSAPSQPPSAGCHTRMD